MQNNETQNLNKKLFDYFYRLGSPRRHSGGCADNVPSIWHVRFFAPCSLYPSAQLYVTVSLMFKLPNIDGLPLVMFRIEQTTQIQTV